MQEGKQARLGKARRIRSESLSVEPVLGGVGNLDLLVATASRRRFPACSPRPVNRLQLLRDTGAVV
jgi:hypothetical protein